MLQQELAWAKVAFAYNKNTKAKIVLDVDGMLVLLEPPRSAARSSVLDEIGVCVSKVVDK